MRLYNTLTRRKEELKTREAGRVSMYICGPTTYNLIHLGNARPLIVFDTVRRYMEYKGFKVDYVQNFTDIDDKIINRAKEEKMDPLALAAKYIKEFYQDAGSLGVREATVHPKVSEHIPEIIEMVQGLVEKGVAYQVDGDVYFSVKDFKGYGKLSGRSLDEMQAGARVNVDERKKDPMDFALWKSAKPGEPSWDSSWGPGRPGWHIECSAMSLKYLGRSFDIHGGGFDLIFPHHENELAQSEAYAGEGTFAHYWMHNGFITVNEEKMSKSLGNFFTVREILAKYDPRVVRFYMLSTHYRSPLDFDDSKLEMSKKSLERLLNTLENAERVLKQKPLDALEGDKSKVAELSAAAKAARENFEKAMDDDFNTALAVAVLFDLTRDINSFMAEVKKGLDPQGIQALVGAKNTLVTLGQEVLGLFEGAGVAEEDQSTVDGLMDLVISIRQKARANKDWATADEIRNRLGEIGIVLEDTPQGVHWKRK
ncbi:MAG: cysteine--tRNA ligase [Clostridia bacterium]|nr:cysteine--tRNA ligase [Clostridia bacterium]